MLIAVSSTTSPASSTVVVVRLVNRQNTFSTIRIMHYYVTIVQLSRYDDVFTSWHGKQEVLFANGCGWIMDVVFVRGAVGSIIAYLFTHTKQMLQADTVPV